MNNPEVLVTIHADGRVQFEVNGVKGSSCSDLVADVQKSLGTVISEEKKAEYFVKPSEAHVKNSY